MTSASAQAAGAGSSPLLRGAHLAREDADPAGGGMSAKERPKGKVVKDSVTLLPCFYFVEVGRPGPWHQAGPPRSSGDSGPGPGAGVRAAPECPIPSPLTFGELPGAWDDLPPPSLLPRPPGAAGWPAGKRYLCECARAGSRPPPPLRVHSLGAPRGHEAPIPGFVSPTCARASRILGALITNSDRTQPCPGARGPAMCMEHRDDGWLYYPKHQQTLKAFSWHSHHGAPICF